MNNLLVTPILFHYSFLDSLCQKAALSLNINLEDDKKYQQFKISIFLNFNRYLMDSLLFIPRVETDKLFSELASVMRVADEDGTLRVLRNNLEYFDEICADFLKIVKNIKK